MGARGVVVSSHWASSHIDGLLDDVLAAVERQRGDGDGGVG